jgi:hypothetical protein
MPTYSLPIKETYEGAGSRLSWSLLSGPPPDYDAPVPATCKGWGSRCAHFTDEQRVSVQFTGKRRLLLSFSNYVDAAVGGDSFGLYLASDDANYVVVGLTPDPSGAIHSVLGVSRDGIYKQLALETRLKRGKQYNTILRLDYGRGLWRWRIVGLKTRTNVSPELAALPKANWLQCLCHRWRDVSVYVDNIFLR